jgi:hypothetical protein
MNGDGRGATYRAWRARRHRPTGRRGRMAELPQRPLLAEFAPTSFESAARPRGRRRRPDRLDRAARTALPRRRRPQHPVQIALRGLRAARGLPARRRPGDPLRVHPLQPGLPGTISLRARDLHRARRRRRPQHQATASSASSPQRARGEPPPAQGDRRSKLAEHDVYALAFSHWDLVAPSSASGASATPASATAASGRRRCSSTSGRTSSIGRCRWPSQWVPSVDALPAASRSSPSGAGDPATA